MSRVGLSDMVFSEMTEKPISSPPQPAKMTSKATNIIMSLVGILAVSLLRSRVGCRGLGVSGNNGHWRDESKRKEGNQNEWKVECRQSRPACSRRTTLDAWESEKKRKKLDLEKRKERKVACTAGEGERHGRCGRVVVALRGLWYTSQRAVRNVMCVKSVGGGSGRITARRRLVVRCFARSPTQAPRESSTCSTAIQTFVPDRRREAAQTARPGWAAVALVVLSGCGEGGASRLVASRCQAA